MKPCYTHLKKEKSAYFSERGMSRPGTEKPLRAYFPDTSRSKDKQSKPLDSRKTPLSRGFLYLSSDYVFECVFSSSLWGCQIALHSRAI